jgi:hypothetical protein
MIGIFSSDDIFKIFFGELMSLHSFHSGEFCEVKKMKGSMEDSFYPLSQQHQRDQILYRLDSYEDSTLRK